MHPAPNSAVKERWKKTRVKGSHLSHYLSTTCKITAYKWRIKLKHGVHTRNRATGETVIRSCFSARHKVNRKQVVFQRKTDVFWSEVDLFCFIIEMFFTAMVHGFRRSEVIASNPKNEIFFFRLFISTHRFISISLPNNKTLLFCNK